MRQWIIDAENILNGSWVEIPEGMKGDRESLQKKLSLIGEVALRFDPFLEDLRRREGEMSQTERKCLEEFLRVLTRFLGHI